MSGTSCDGVDAVAASFAILDRGVEWHVRAFECFPYEAAMRSALLNLCQPAAPISEALLAGVVLGEKFAEAAFTVANAAGLEISDIDFIASHGHTIWHQPTAHEFAGNTAAGTLQIGEPAVIAARTGRPAISNFRTADVALGGQGAPLAPVVDYELFASDSCTRAVLNLGGIANVTVIPAGANVDEVVAFDIGPANMVLDWLAERFTSGELRCDKDGHLALAGRADAETVAAELDAAWFRKAPPKSTGRELFGNCWCERFLDACGRRHLSSADTMATAAAITVGAVSDAFASFVVTAVPVSEVIVCGGGVHNPALMDGLKQALAPALVSPHEAYGVSSDAKEALAFAMLGLRAVRGLPTALPRVTGAASSSIGGVFSVPPADGLALRRLVDKLAPLGA
ncbi:MAG: anhydro-N-acetylmuramic acid kinase [Armatimonadetes bacterium]|nr:anhydro-N-acetylmuramic acid kinase [Armatimonadota bacterium]MDE2206790.1 anhydro-N-acetylmuramic acid kinase [Armatimonadota bacterium]